MPATRFSDRVLFGTGKALEEIVEGNFSKAKLFKDEEYLEIKNFINLFQNTFLIITINNCEISRIM